MNPPHGVEWIIGSRRPGLWLRLITAGVVIGLSLLLWKLSLMLLPRLQYIVPDPCSLAAGLVHQLQSRFFWLDAGASALRVWSGMILGFATGFPLALVVASYPKLRLVAFGYIGITRAFPRYTLLFILFVGVGVFSEIPKFILTWWAVFSTQVTLIYLETVRLLDSGDSRIEMLPVIGVKKRHQLLKVIAPMMLPQSFTALYLAAASAWAVLIISEAAVSRFMPYGIGYRINMYFVSDDVGKLVEYSTLLILCVMCTWLVIWLIQKRLLRWYGEKT